MKASEWLLLLLYGLWMVAVIYTRLPDDCYYFLMASGWLVLFLKAFGWWLLVRWVLDGCCYFLLASGWMLDLNHLPIAGCTSLSM